MKTTKQTQLNDHLLDYDFSFSQDFEQSFRIAKIVAEQYARNENAMAVLSNMVSNTSCICYGRLGEKLGLLSENEEVPSIWEKKILDRIHPDDVAEKIAWELQFLAFVKQQPIGNRKDYYLQHFLRFKDTQGTYHVLRHRIIYLDYDADGNVMLTLCLYTAHCEQQNEAGIYNSLIDARVKDTSVCTQGLLSERECEILRHISQGWLSKQIADTLCISVNTVNNHRQNILRKLLCQNTTEAVGVAQKQGLLQQ